MKLKLTLCDYLAIAREFAEGLFWVSLPDRVFRWMMRHDIQRNRESEEDWP